MMLVGQFAKIKVGLWLDCQDQGSHVGQIAKIKVGLWLDCQDQRSHVGQIAKIKVGLWFVRLLMSCLKFRPCHLHN